MDKAYSALKYPDTIESAMSAPEDLDPETKQRWESFCASSLKDPISSLAAVAGVICGNEKLFDQFKELHKKAVLAEAAKALAFAPKALDLKPEFLREILLMSATEIRSLVPVSIAIEKIQSELTIEDVKELVNEASVMSVMEETKAEEYDEGYPEDASA